MSSDELIGKNFGGYEVLSEIGQGGMATVYLAQQKSIARLVALKVLPRQYLKDDTYMQRFEQEVKIVSTLEHRNIVPVYDYGDFEGQPYIVMRYLPAGSIDDLIRQGPIPPEKIVEIISQVAPALDHAHGKSILHRDLKPSNILLDDAGGAYLTDFGIARIVGQQGPGITTQGVVGTPSYMSPEQAQGFELDGRSDVYSLGVMLFEMATGRRPFESDTPYSIAVMQVTQNPPQPRVVNPRISAAIESVILKALQKNPRDRFQTAEDLANALKQAVHNPESAFDTEPKMKVSDFAPPPAQPVPQAQPSPPTPQSNPPIQAVPPVQQRRRDRVRRKAKNNVWLSVALGGVVGCGLLAGIVVAGALIIGLISGGDIFSGGDGGNGESAQVDNIQTPASTPNQQPSVIATLNATEASARETLIARSTSVEPSLTAQALVTNAPSGPTPTKIIQPVGVRAGTPDLVSPLRAVTGELLFFDFREDSSEIVRLNLDSWIETQPTLDTSTNSYPMASPDGKWIVFQSDRDGDFDLYIVNRVGSQLRQLTFNDYTDRLPAWSPDGEWIMYSSDVRNDGTYDLYKIRPNGEDNQLVFSNGYRNSHVRYSPDGQFIVFTSGPDPQDARTWEIALLNLETMQGPVFLTNNDIRDASPSFSPDGERILFSTFNDGDNDIAVMNRDGSNVQILYTGPNNEWTASFSPDGQYIAIWATIDGEEQILLMTADGRNIQQITTTGGAYPTWIAAVDD